ncbi:hypothetical protein KR222_002702 [Zaprionus bogoriensis]|nr:hypothetical protein KR222_002702 [Zaprionus bogoriensis]
MEQLNFAMRQLKAELLEQQQLNERLSQQLNTEQQQQQSKDALVLVKEQQIAELTANLTQLQQQMRGEQADFKQEKLQLEQQSRAQLQVEQQAQAQLRAKLQELSASLAEQKKSNAQVESALKSHQQQLQASEHHNAQLQQQQQQVLAEASDAARRLEDQLESKEAKIEELQSDVKCCQTQIAALQEANMQLTTNMAEAQQQLNRQEELMDRQKQQWDDLQQENSNTMLSLRAEKDELLEQLHRLNERHEMMQAEHITRMKQTEVEMADCNQKYEDLEREKNATIAELNQKIARISNVVVAGNDQEQDNLLHPKDDPQSAKAVAQSKSIASAARQGSLKRRRVPIKYYASDFHTDSDDAGNSYSYLSHKKQQFSKNKPAVGRGNCVKSAAVEPLSAFDVLRKSN